jgi:predicted RNA-binding Zn ribbon-like protein
MSPRIRTGYTGTDIIDVVDTTQPVTRPAGGGAAYPPAWVSEFPFRSGRLCLDFVSTLGSRGQLDIERLRAPADFKRWVREAGLGQLRKIDEIGLAAALELREAIYVLITSKRSRHAHAVACINRAATRTPLVPQLDETGEASIWAPVDGTEQVLATIARDAIDLMSSPMRTRIRECARPDCTIVFLDASRPGSRRWCSMEACGNQLKSASLRAKRRAARTSKPVRASPS